MNLGMLRSRWVWPAVILFSAVTSGLFFYLAFASPFRLITTLWFLLVCPGMAFVRLFQFDETYYEWTLAIALSISLDGIVACILLYTGFWSIELGLLIVILLSLSGALLQILFIQPQPDPGLVGAYQNLQPNRAEVLRCASCQSEKKQWKAGFSRSGRQRYQCSQCKKIYTPNLNTTMTEPAQPAIRRAVQENNDYAISRILRFDLQHSASLVRQYTARLPIRLFRTNHK